MDSLIVGGVGNFNDKKTFFNHVFSTTDESKAEFFNVFQYAFLAIIPIVLLNKSIQHFIPDVDIDKSSLEILAEIFIQIFLMFFGIIFTHRLITFLPTYSGFKYDSFSLTNVILAFFIIIFSIQTKLGLKINILFQRFYSSFFDSNEHTDKNLKPFKRSTNTNHTTSQSDFYDHSTHNPVSILPTPTTTTTHSDYTQDSYMGPLAANSLIGSSFGATF
jgi:hypothetical protein